MTLTVFVIEFLFSTICSHILTSGRLQLRNFVKKNVKKTRALGLKLLLSVISCSPKHFALENKINQLLNEDQMQLHE